MPYKLIPIADRQKYQCCRCGETRSVKYLIPTVIVDALDGMTTVEKPYCNKCALRIAALETQTKEMFKNEQSNQNPYGA